MSTTLTRTSPLTIYLDLEELADQLAPLLARRLPEPRPWLNTEEAAEYMSCSRGRLYDLVQIRKLEPRRDGRRLLFRRSDLDAYLETAPR